MHFTFLFLPFSRLLTAAHPPDGMPGPSLCRVLCGHPTERAAPSTEVQPKLQLSASRCKDCSLSNKDNYNCRFQLFYHNTAKPLLLQHRTGFCLQVQLLLHLTELPYYTEEAGAQTSLSTLPSQRQVSSRPTDSQLPENPEIKKQTTGFHC